MDNVIQFKAKKTEKSYDWVNLFRDDDGTLKVQFDWSYFEDMVIDEIISKYGDEIADTPIVGVDFGLSVDDFDVIEFDLIEDDSDETE